VICGQLENCTLTFVCPLALKDKLGGLHHSLVTNCLKCRCTFFVFNEVTSFCTPCPMKNFLDLNSVTFNNATEWIEQTSFN